MEKSAPKKPQGWLVLFLVAVVAGLALAATNELTKGPIAQRSLESANAARKAVLSQADAFESLEVTNGSGVDSGYRGLKDGQPIGYVAQSTVQGYGGPIEVVVGMDLTGTLTAISVGGTNFSETAGLGSKAKEPAFTDQFIGLKLPAKLRGNVDAISGATITSNAVVMGVNQAGQYMASMAGLSIEDASAGNASVEGNTATVVKDGFGGPIEITVTVDENKAITAISVGGEQFNETPGYGAKAKEPSFTDQFVGKSGKLALNVDVDAISGATITSAAVVNGVNEALAALRGEAVATPEPAPEPTPVPEGRTARATKEGYESPIEVVLIVDDAGRILAMTVGENASFAETKGIGTKVKEPAFIDQFIGKSGPFEIGKNVDAVAGATWSSKGVVDAVNEALNSLPVMAAAEQGRTSSAVREGFESPIEVVVTVDDAGIITAMKVGGNASFAETPGLGTKVKDQEFVSQFIGKAGPFELGKNIDAVAGATFSSKGVVEAVNAALSSLPEASQAQQPRTARATKEGYESPIEVVVTVDQAGAITAITVGENASFAETPGLGTKVKDQEFISQFIGKTGPFEIGGNIDAVSGATFSSKGVVDAVNEALKSLAQ